MEEMMGRLGGMGEEGEGMAGNNTEKSMLERLRDSWGEGAKRGGA